MMTRSFSPRQSLTFRLSRRTRWPQFNPILQSTNSIPSLPATSRVLTTGQDLRPWKRRTFRAPLGFERHLATAWDDHRLVEDMPSIPFERISYVTPSPPSSRPPQPRLYDIMPFDVKSPLRIGEPEAPHPRSRINIQGVPGDMEEMLAVFDACVQVGKLDRAALIIKRFARMGNLSGQDMIALHNRYLRESLAQLQASRGLDKAEELHKWYELEIRSQLLPETPETIAYMLKASILTSDGSRLQRLVTRYMGLLPQQAGLGDLFVGDVLTDQDLATIAHICPAYDFRDEVSTSLGDGVEGQDAEAVVDATPNSDPTAVGPGSGDAWTTQQVLSTPQKGMGLKMLKQTLSLFSRIPEGQDISALSHAERKEVQAKLEVDCVDAAIARWREENQELIKMGLNISVASRSMSSRLYEWQQALEKRLRKELESIELAEQSGKKTQEDLDRCLYGPFMRLAEPGRLAAITILSTLSTFALQGADSMPALLSVVNSIAKVVEEDVRVQLLAKQQPAKAQAKQPSQRRLVRLARMQKHVSTDKPAETSEQASTTSEAGVSLPAAPGMGEHLSTSKSDVLDILSQHKNWPTNIRTKLGVALISMLIETARTEVTGEDPVTKARWTQKQAAFVHSTRHKKGKKIGVLWMNPSLVEIMKREPGGEALARHLPMVVEPEPWSEFDKGGFLTCPSPLIRVKPGDKDQKMYAEAAIARGDMDQVFKGLDILGRTAWRINRPVFDVMLAAWNSGQEVANIPPLDPQISIPVEPDASCDPYERNLWFRTVKAEMNRKQGLHSVRCFINFQLEIARAFRDQTFYFPHNIDFRGRAYPIPPYLNHMGADHVRGLMCFAKGKELGEGGLRWLKIHLANVFGFDKASLKDRENFATENLSNIYDSVENPLSGSRWWLQAEDPWQCLATCFELKAALQAPDPTKFVSHMPVHQDGTCNGLQHYAALGGDTWGAQHVNLEPGDRPADVYAAVAQLVNEGIAKDLEENNVFARIVEGKITRKVVKQTVMTNVYGVTFVGAKKQVLKQLNDLYPNLGKDSGVPSALLASYITTKVFKALANMFGGANDIQTWLGEIGGRVCRALTPEQLERVAAGSTAADESRPGASKAAAKSKSAKSEVGAKMNDLLNQFRSTIVWTTPLRMPVVQPYRKSGTRVIHTCLQNLILSNPERTDPVDRRKQLQAFPPNFIHSLDASHMILTALECDALGLSFAAVHDSFWTHAADVDIMNNVIRDAFIRIHSEDVIGRLASEFEARYQGSIYLAKINAGSEAAKKVNAHRRKTRLSTKEELLLERRRLALLGSQDPQEIEEGKNMVTPASIVEASAAEDLVEPEDLGGTKLGSIPDRAMGKHEMADESTTREDESDAGPFEAEAEAEAMDTGAEEAGLGDESESAATNATFGGEKELQALLGSSYYEEQIAGKSRKQAKTTKRQPIGVWMSLTFPAIPKKGDFDVRRLKESKYFFS